MNTDKDILKHIKQHLLRRREYRWQSLNRLAEYANISIKHLQDLLESSSEIKLAITGSGLRIARYKSRISW